MLFFQVVTAVANCNYLCNDKIIIKRRTIFCKIASIDYTQ